MNELFIIILINNIVMPPPVGERRLVPRRGGDQRAAGGRPGAVLRPAVQRRHAGPRGGGPLHPSAQQVTTRVLVHRRYTGGLSFFAVISGVCALVFLTLSLVLQPAGGASDAAPRSAAEDPAAPHGLVRPRVSGPQSAGRPL